MTHFHRLLFAMLALCFPLKTVAQPFEKSADLPKEAKDANLFEASLNDDGSIDLWYFKYQKSKKQNLYTYLKFDKDFKLISTEKEKEPVGKKKKAGFDPELGESFEKEGLAIKLTALKGMVITPERNLYEYNEKKGRYVFEKTVTGKKADTKSEAGVKYQYVMSMIGDVNAMRQEMINDALLRGLNPYTVGFAMKPTEGTWYGEGGLTMLAAAGGKYFVVVFNKDGSIASEKEIALAVPPTPGFAPMKSGVLADRFWLLSQSLNSGKKPDASKRGMQEYVEISITGEVLKKVAFQLNYPATSIDQVSVSEQRVIFAGKTDPRFNNLDDKALAAAAKKDVLMKRTLAHVYVLSKDGLVKEWTEDFKTISPKAKVAPKAKKPGKFAHTPKLDARANIIQQHENGFDVVYAALDFYGLRFSNDVTLTSVYAMAGNPKSRVARLGGFYTAEGKTAFYAVEFAGYDKEGFPVNVPLVMRIDGAGNPTGVYNLGMKKFTLDYDFPLIVNETTGKWIFFGKNASGSQVYFGDAMR
jgi:hypothetical protein